MRIYLDSGVLIAAFRASKLGFYTVIFEKILDNPAIELCTSQFVKFEVIPKAVFHENHDEQEFYDVLFEKTVQTAQFDQAFLDSSFKIACQYGLRLADSFHVAAAIQLEVDCLITSEKPNKTIHRANPEIRIISLEEVSNGLPLS